MTDWFFPKMVISGAQTGADRGALDAAKRLGYECGGWVTIGRKAEDGVVPAHYKVTECSSTKYPVRTRLNVECSDATLLFGYEEPTGGTALTIKIAKENYRPHLLIILKRDDDPEEIASRVRVWFAENRPRVLNVAGQRESKAKGIQHHVEQVMYHALQTPDPYGSSEGKNHHEEGAEP